MLLCIICSAQEHYSVIEPKYQYIQLLNYSPQNFQVDLENKPQSNFIENNLNSIWKLLTVYRLKEQLNDNEIKWLEKQVNQIAVAFFLENRPILLQSDGGYSGCSEKLIETKLINGNKVTILKYCYGGCVGDQNVVTFIQIFNNRTEKLLAK